MEGMPSVPLHDALKPLGWLAGRWTTKDGQGRYPNIPDFHYHEDLEFACIGQPMFNFVSTSRNPEKQTPMHQERGFLRIKPGSNDLAFVVSHNFGLTSLEEGRFDPENKTIVLETVNVSRISFAKPPYVKKFKRVIKLIDESTLEIILHMETDSTPLTEHLRAVYQKVQMVG
ncbi:peroxynitrite isomerase THAP4-like [Pectinophora gossypiella]|uniref:peroxynitrite isomerase THAP4-like n=1 Tax=Pectinophora gossypiella TaxID=13191 RepID=UPI00214E67D0|nr:peroxynitrite isomerase THAP4-like [Pectinophora gossypiella]